MLYERGNPGLFSAGQLLEREGNRPHSAFVEARRVVVAQRRVPGVELLWALEDADILAVFFLIWHPVP